MSPRHSYSQPGDTGAPSHSSYHLPRLVWLALLAFLSWTILGRLFDRSQPTASTLDELTTGSWRPRKERLDSLEDVRALIKNSDKAQGFECEDGGDARRVAAASYEFVPSSGRLVWTWDQEQVVRYLLSSPEGLLIVGDSLGQQMMSAFRMLLSPGDLVRTEVLSSATLTNGRKTSLHHTISLLPSHPIYAQLLETGEVSLSRLRRPLLQFIRGDHLVSSDEISRIVPPSVVENGSVGRAGYAYGDDPDWMAFVSTTLDRYGRSDDLDAGSLENTRPTVVLINTGPHWNTVAFTNVYISDLVGAMLTGYRGMVASVLRRLPSNPHLHLIVQSQHYIPTNCSSSLVPPDLSPPSSPPQISPGNTRYNHHLFPQFNSLFASGISHYRASTRLAHVEILDDYDMIAKRQEAMRAPDQGDCLHVCLGVRSTTVRLLMQYLLDS